MIERSMPETPSGTSLRVEVVGSQEVKANDPRARVINAFNRTMDRIALERDGILNRVRSEGPGFLTDHDRMVVLATQYAEEGAQRLTGGKPRLDDNIENDKFEVEVEDRTIGQKYKRKEGIPVGGLLNYLESERERLRSLEKQAWEERRSDDSRGFSREADRLFSDEMTLMRHSRSGYWSLMGDYWTGVIPENVKQAASSDGTSTDYNMNRVGTEAYLRSNNPQIQELGGESQDENWLRAAQDILKDRRELEIPSREALVRVSEPAISVPETPMGETVALPLRKIPPKRVSALAKPDKPETPMGETVALPWGNANSARRDTSGGVNIEERSREVVEEKESRAKLVLKAALEKIGSGNERIRKFVEKLPRNGLGRVLTHLGVLSAVATAVYLGKDQEALPIDQAARISQPPERGFVIPEVGKQTLWDPSSVRSGILASPESRGTERRVVVAGPKTRVEIDTPSLGKRTLEVRILTGNEPDIFNVPQVPSSTDSSKPSHVGISPVDIKRVIENPQADDETAKMIRSYLDEDTLKLLTRLTGKEIFFPTKGPLDEEIKENYASLRGKLDADWTQAATRRPFNMRSADNLKQLESLKGKTYEEAWRVLVADCLLTGELNKGVVGYLVKEGKIVDIILRANTSEGFSTRNIEPLQAVRIPDVQP